MRFPIKLNLNMTSYLLGRALARDKRFPLVLMLEPLHACNLSCRGCGRVREYRDTMDRQLSIEECLAAAHTCGAPVVSISGGEPLLYPEIDTLVDTLSVLGRHIYLCTNGIKLAEFVERNQPRPNLFLSVHVDGLAETHDAMAGRAGVFRAATEGIRLAKEKGFTVATNTTVYKPTRDDELSRLFAYLSSLGVDGFFLAPGYNYGGVEEDDFLNKEEVHEKFRGVHAFSKRFCLLSSPLYLDFLCGKKDYSCAPWGTVTYNPLGWKAPCYLITDAHYHDYRDFMESVDWDYYQSGQDPRCSQCMMHSGFEPAAVLNLRHSPKDLWAMLAWNLT